MADPPPFRLEILTVAGPGTVSLDDVAQPSITAALEVAFPGAVIKVGRGRFGPDTEVFPLRVPTGVTLRGPTPPDIPSEARKHLPTPQPGEITGPGSLIEVVGDDVTIQDLTITSTRGGTTPTLSGADVATLVVHTCTLTGSVRLERARSVGIRWTLINRGSVVCIDCSDLVITGGRLTEPPTTEAAIVLDGGEALRIEAMAVTSESSGVRAERVTDLTVAGCAILAADAAIGATASSRLWVSGNRLRGSRAVSLTDCTDGEVAANGIDWADIAIELDGCTEVNLGRNHIDEARIDLAER